jgi:transcriptional regulator GlxA family with amidase domain
MSLPSECQTCDGVISEILRVIEENCARCDLSLHALAKEVNVSSRHLGRLFQKHTGHSFRYHLRESRLQRAAQLLAQLQGVKTAAALAGYSSRSHFDSNFRARFGCTPAQFRNRNGRPTTPPGNVRF